MATFLASKSSGKAFRNMGDDDKEERYFSDDDENWTKLQDIASRRRIQNRISQRKRRRRLRESSLSQSETSRSNSPCQSTGTPKVSRSKTASLEPPLLTTHTRSRSSSQISNFSLSSMDGDLGDITPTQNNPLPCLPSIERSMPSTPQPQTAGNWDQQFFDQAFMSEIQDFEGSTVDFLYQAGAAGAANSMFASPETYQSSIANYSPALSYTSESSIDGSHDSVHTRPMLSNDFDDLFNTQVPFGGGNDLRLTPLRFEYDSLPSKDFPYQPAAENNGYPTPPLSIHSHNSSLQPSPECAPPSTFTRTDISGNTALHLAAEKGHMGIVQLLLDSGIDINAANKDSKTCLHIAVAQDNISMAGLLLEKGAAADAKNALGQSSLHLAVEKGNTALVGLVLDYAKDFNARDCLGQTAFHRAIAMGWEEIVRVMLLRGLNFQAQVGGFGQQMMG